MRVIAVAEHGDIDQMRRCRILPDLAINASEVDPLVKPAAGPFLAGVGNEVQEAADVFVLALFQPICPRSPPSRASRHDPSRTEETGAPGDRRLRACARRAGCGRQFDVPPPCQHRVSGIDMPKQHRRAVVGFEPHAGTSSLTAKAMLIGERVQNFRCRQPEGSGARKVAQSPSRSRPARRRVLS
jgi:hypothetical protein